MGHLLCARTWQEAAGITATDALAGSDTLGFKGSGNDGSWDWAVNEAVAAREHGLEPDPVGRKSASSSHKVFYLGQNVDSLSASVSSSRK